MQKFSLKAKVGIILTTLLLIMGALQNFILIATGIQRELSYEEELVVKSYSERIDALVKLGVTRNQDFRDYLGAGLPGGSDVCVSVLVGGTGKKDITCSYGGEIYKQAELAISEGKIKRKYVGLVWKLLFLRRDALLISFPVLSQDKHVRGVVTVEKSLLPVYERFEREAGLAMVYLVINAIVVSCVGFFRLIRIIFKPIDKLIRLSDQYEQNSENPFYLLPHGNEFRQLSTSLNGMIKRIESDRSRLKQMVEELERSNKELRENQELIVRSEKLASIGRLSAGMAHEIGNPLSIIQGYVDLLQRDDITREERGEFSVKAGIELDRIHSLIKEMLNFAGSFERRREPVNPAELVDEVVKILQVEKRVKNCDIRYDSKEEDCLISSERDSLKQVLVNCILNAADSYEKETDKPKFIDIRLQKRDSNDGKGICSIRILDNGCGIQEDALSNVFDPFYTTKEPGKGTGLGLFVSHMLMERIGGKITLHGNENGGTVVELEIPIN